MFSYSRRRFVKGLAMGGVLGASGVLPALTKAEQIRLKQGPSELVGNSFQLRYNQLPVNFTGKQARAVAINGSVPAPVLRWKEGDTVSIKVINQLAEDTSIHWHGLILPSSQDGVPHISEGFNGIRPGESFTYRFPIRQNGTYWYHSHSGFQEQLGSYGAIIIDPAKPEPFEYDREFVVLLSDWSDEKPKDVFAKLKKQSHYYNTNLRTISDSLKDLREKGWSANWAEREMWNQMRMSDRDISDVTGMTYTFLMNGQTPEEGWLGVFNKGEKIRLRFINAAAMTIFDIRIPGMKMTVVASDGQHVQPVDVDEFRIGVAETYDVIVEPEDEAHAIFAQAIDRSGYALGILTPDPSQYVDVPEMDPSPILTHADMGMKHDDAMSGEHAHHMHDNTNHGRSNHGTSSHRMGTGRAGFGSARPVSHDIIKTGPHIDMLADDIQYRMDDPGIGLRNNGRRVLTYADLLRLGPTDDPREPDREIDLHLVGNMHRYMWSFNGIPYRDAEPIFLKLGERVRFNLINNTMMNHPIHLHGMWSDLENGNREHIPRKHTVIVQPGSRISYLVTADAPGSWAYHCHLLYHMSGMFRKIVVS